MFTYFAVACGFTIFGFLIGAVLRVSADSDQDG